MPKYRIVFRSGTASTMQLGQEIEVDAESYDTNGEGMTKVYIFFEGELGSADRRIIKEISATDVLTIDAI